MFFYLVRQLLLSGVRMEAEQRKVLVGNPTYLQTNGLVRYNEEGKSAKDQLVYTIMNFPFRCNLRCLKCYREPAKHKEDLDMDTRKRIIRESKELGALVLGIPGEGEPFYYFDEIREVVGQAGSLDMTTLLYSNGTLFDEEKLRFLYDNNVSLIVSCDSLNPDIFRYLTKVGDASKVREGLEMARKIYKPSIKREDGTTYTRMGLITIVSEQNMGDVAELSEFAGDDFFHIVNTLVRIGGAEDNWEKLIGSKGYNAYMEVAKQYSDTFLGGITTPWEDGNCAAFHNGITITTNGDVQICPAVVKKPIGNAKTMSVKEIWEKQQELVRKINFWCIARRPNLEAYLKEFIGF